MTTESTDSTRYPIGLWQSQDAYTIAEIRQLVDQIGTLPDAYALVLTDISAVDLSRQYRPDSWTIQQLVHHVADTHMLHFMRLKNALTAPNTTGVMADVNAWAALSEGQYAPISDSLTLLKGIHQRIAFLVGTLRPDQLAITYYHPGRQRDLTLAQALSVIVWHAEHHLAHIRLALQTD
ncbi:DinB family protein [Spirosoma agri]|uniref:DinB-like domain-containing protein n=1 Tax=Spirosoma agri TaxID=1987381 RepID=A0A6M0IGT1_9BACT|nr:DinB family protein [Spirosoma agri]NEU67486.1 hypothetical protein [Spirosoma agri]